MGNRRLEIVLIAVLLTTGPSRVWAQVGVGGGMAVSPAAPYRISPYYAAPGMYGMMLGSPSFGSVRTYTEFSSSYGPGFNYGSAPYGLLPGRYGVGLWRPGYVAPGYVYGASYYSYRTFPIPYGTAPAVPPPPVGAYAPAAGPAPAFGW